MQILSPDMGGSTIYDRLPPGGHCTAAGAGSSGPDQLLVKTRGVHPPSPNPPSAEPQCLISLTYDQCRIWDISCIYLCISFHFKLMLVCKIFLFEKNPNLIQSDIRSIPCQN